MKKKKKNAYREKTMKMLKAANKGSSSDKGKKEKNKKKKGDKK
jgi:hypothetical protein